MKNYIDKIAVCGNENRRNAICKILEELKISYSIKGDTCNNIVVSNDVQGKKIVIGAHYDVFAENCPGANDNGAACVILLNLIENLRESKRPYEFVFFDKEEKRMEGSRAYIEIVGKNNIEAMINLDMCGMGNNIVLAKKDFNNILTKEPYKSIINECKNVFTQLPPGDSWSFEQERIPFIFIINSTNDDLKWYAEFAECVWGNHALTADFLKTMHKVTDTIDTINIEYVEKIYNYLLERLK